MYLMTWLDVRRQVWAVLNQNKNGHYPDFIKRINFSWSGVDVFVGPSQESAATSWLTDIFPGWFDPVKSVIRLINDEEIPVDIQEGDDTLTVQPPNLPLWWDISRRPNYEPDSVDATPDLPTPWEKSGPHVVAFYSFKGGVSRTTHMLGCLAALRDHKATQSQGYRVLLIDADVEAPGFSFWGVQSERISYVDFLEMLHLRPEDHAAKTLEYVAAELEKTKQQFGKVTTYVLPAFRNEAQLLNWPVKPEHLVRGLSSPWILADRIFQLGKQLAVDLVLIDLRAGLSEMSSPLMLDPRVDRFLVTTLNQQSLKGAKLVLRQIAKAAPPFKAVQEQDFSDPVVIFSMVHDEAMDNEDHRQARVDFADLYPESTEDLASSSRLEFISTKFAQELLSIKGWDDFYSKISGSHLEMEMREVVERWLPVEDQNNKPVPKRTAELARLCKDLIFADQSQEQGMLFTQSLRNMANDFIDSLPNVVVMGSKGAGKTYTFLQLATMGTWSDFCAGASVRSIKATGFNFFPFLESENLDAAAREITHKSRRQYLGNSPSDEGTPWRSRILHASQKELAWTEVDWERFWISEISQSLGLECAELTPLGLHEAVKLKSKPVILLVDGLEDLLKEVGKDVTQQRALRVLIQLPGKLRQIRDVQIGLIIFVRLDLAREAIIQNFGQFSVHYAKYELRWEFKEMLQLIAWLCIKVGLIDQTKNIQGLGYAELDKLLYPLWGMRMGAPNSREARTSVWVYCALADYNKNLQARDLVRLLYEAASGSKGKDPSRLLSPTDIKRALPECSRKKVEEAVLEFPRLGHIRDLLESSATLRRVPFSRMDFDLSHEDLNFLKANGIITEVNGEYHIPEIYRFGLKFELTKKARPRVVAFGKQLLGPILKELQAI